MTADIRGSAPILELPDSPQVPQKSQGDRTLKNFRLSELDIRNLEAIQKSEAKRGMLISQTQAVQLALSEAAKKRR